MKQLTATFGTQRPRGILMLLLIQIILIAAGGATSSARLSRGPNVALRVGSEPVAILYRFPGGSNGESPQSSVLADGTGAFYGTAYGGIALQCDCGVAYKLTPSGSTYTETAIYVFKGKKDGSTPVAGLVADKTGALGRRDSLGRPND